MTSLVAQYFLNHRLDLDEITWQMEEFARAGYHGVYAHARQGLLTPYMSHDWWAAIERMLEVCKSTGMELWIWDEDYFPSGTLGGRLLWQDPGLCARNLELTAHYVSGAGPFEVDFAAGELLCAFAVPRQEDGSWGEPVDITQWAGTRRQNWQRYGLLHRAYSPLVSRVGPPHWRATMSENRFAVAWTPPQAGEYAVVGAVMQNRLERHPDILRPEGIASFIEQTHEEYRRRFPDEIGTVICGTFTDEPSPGAGLYPWSPVLPGEFSKDHGYDIIAQLPHLALDIDDRSPAVRCHFRQTQGRLQRENYVGQIARWCRTHGVINAGHLTRTEWLSLTAAFWPNELRCYREMDIPSADPLGAASAWTDAAPYHTGLKVASSAAHLFGHAQAGSDCLAVMGDEVSLRDLKWILDYQMVMGINHFTVHGLSYSLDGMRKDEVPPSIFYQHTEWKHMRVLLDEVTATCAALTGGEHCCELAVLYPSTSLACRMRPDEDWMNLPDEARIHAVVEELLSSHRDFDFIDEMTLQEMTAADGTLTTPEPYRVIILPHLWYIEQATAEALLRFAKAGGRVIAVGQVPSAVGTSLDSPLASWADADIETVSQCDAALCAALPGISVTGEGARDVFVLHRRNADMERYFAFNRAEAPFSGAIEGIAATIPPRGSVLLAGGAVEPPAPPPASVATVLSDGWLAQFPPNQVPLNFWHAHASPDRPAAATLAGAPGFDLLQRHEDPVGHGDQPAWYYCRFMLTGDIPDARLVMDDETIAGNWQVYVNDRLIEKWEREVLWDCRNRVADIGFALAGGTTPTLNHIVITTCGPGRGLKDMLHLTGSFTCEFRHGHLSFSYLQAAPQPCIMESLQSWTVTGYPTFSGSVTYRRIVEIAHDGHYMVDLGRVETSAAVQWDDGPTQVSAWPPYTTTAVFLTAGPHELSVEVTNGPGNRNRASNLPAGLLGPVYLLEVER